jgi:hypothetical protein
MTQKTTDAEMNRRFRRFRRFRKRGGTTREDARRAIRPARATERLIHETAVPAMTQNTTDAEMNRRFRRFRR